MSKRIDEQLSNAKGNEKEEEKKIVYTISNEKNDKFFFIFCKKFSESGL